MPEQAMRGSLNRVQGRAVRSLRRREFCAAVLAGATRAGAAPEQMTIAYQALAGYAWPLFLAQQGGYYAKYGLDAKPVLAAYPGGVAMLVHDQAILLINSLQQLLPAAVKDHSLVAVGAPMNRSSFSLIASKEVTSIRDL